jgi:asparagine synthase (glutamine-hydrolysing)
MQTGALVLTRRGDAPSATTVRAALGATGIADATVQESAGTVLVIWGVDAPSRGGAMLLAATARRREHDLSAQVLPPFAAVVRTGEDEVVATADALGFRHLYHCAQDGWAAASTSARLLAALTGAALDRDALSVQSLLGWQVGQATWFAGVTKLAPGCWIRLRQGRCDVEVLRPRTWEPIDLDDAVASAARVLREHLTAYVCDHPDATLQLTGGQDSRILLSAIPRDLRRGMTAITLAVPGSADVAIAGALAARVGMVHRVEALESLAGMDPAEAHALCVDSSLRLEGMADPVALAALTLAERRFDQGHRIAGLGGEVARGFYYLGRAGSGPVTRQRVARLAAWRMFANEAVDPAALAAGFRDRAREVTVDRIHEVMASSGRDWLSATDDFYLDQRMQRWAGVTDTAVCFDRSVVNPMLDDRFIAIARGMAPESKRHSLFLARLQMELDPDLGRLPLDDRPAPEAYARPGVANRARAAATVARKTVRKVRQRVGHESRPPAGGAVLAGKVVEHWRAHPEALEPARRLGVLDDAWWDGVVSGGTEPAPSAVAFAVNLTAMHLPETGVDDA